MKILGISAFYHDSSIALIEDGKIIFACQEERLTRKKHDSSFPTESIKSLFQYCNLIPQDIDSIVFYEKPFLKFERLLETYLAFAPKGFVSFVKAIPLWLHEKLFQKKLLIDKLVNLGFSKTQANGILFSEHHLSHAASAFYPSGLKKALVLTMDGVGEWETTTVYLGEQNQLKKIYELRFPHSLGMLYSAFTYHCGFKVNSGEYKLMGLAPYGTPRFAEKIKTHLIDIQEDGSFKLNMKYFNFCVGLTMTNLHFNDLFENSFRQPEAPLEQIHMDLAASVQDVLEEVILKICRSLQKKFQVDAICLAGGVALNCAANGKLHSQNLFNSIWIQPAAGDAGGSLGAAMAAYYLHFKKERTLYNEDLMKSALGPSYSHEEIESALLDKNLVFKKHDFDELYRFTAQEIRNQKTVGWFQGRLEFGPRALGNRSILADARSSSMQRNLNLKIKFRESFRPFAPVLLEEDVKSWFDFDGLSPYMLFLAHLRKDQRLEMTLEQKQLFGIKKLDIVRSQIPAVTHIDYTSRIQTVNKATHPTLYPLLSEFKKITGTSVLVNTSFNIRGEPIVCSPSDAIHCFLGTDLDLLVIENYVLIKSEQDPALLQTYREQFELD